MPFLYSFIYSALIAEKFCANPTEAIIIASRELVIPSIFIHVLTSGCTFVIPPIIPTARGISISPQDSHLCFHTI